MIAFVSAEKNIRSKKININFALSNRHIFVARCLYSLRYLFFFFFCEGCFQFNLIVWTRLVINYFVSPNQVNQTQTNHLNQYIINFIRHTRFRFCFYSFSFCVVFRHVSSRVSSYLFIYTLLIPLESPRQ